MAYYLKYNGVDLTDLVKVRSVEIPSLPSIEHSVINMFERDGNVYNGASYNEREIKITFIIYPMADVDNVLAYDIYVNDVKRAFYTKKEAKLFCGDETLYIWAVPVGEMIMTELANGCCECEVNLVAYDPYWYSTTTNSVNNDDAKKFTVENESDTNIYPIIQVGFTKDTTFCQIENQNTGERILIGGASVTEGTVIKKDTKIIADNMESTTGWTQTSAPIDSNRSTGGTLALNSGGTGLMCGNFGSTSGATWHGACYKKSLNTSVEDFKVRVRMSHNSTGKSGDPYHPYKNEASTSYFYKVDAKNGAVLRESASSSAKKLLTIPKGTQVTGTVSNGWVKITYNSKTGYVDEYYLTRYVKDGSTSSTQCNYVTVKNTAIRASASKSATNKKTIPAGKCIRVITSTKYPVSGTDKGKFYKLAKKYEGVTGYVWIDNLVKASEYTVEYKDEVDTADDKVGVCEVYGFSANNVQLFKMAMIDDNEYYEFTYPIIKKNGSEFLVDKTTAPSAKTRSEYDDDSRTIERVLSGRYGDWNEFYGELYIQRIDNKWYAYVDKIKDGNSVKKIKSKEVVDKDNADEKLNYIVIYIGTTGDTSKASGMAVNHIEVKTASKIDNSVTYNFLEMEKGDILTIDNSIPSVELNGVECSELIDVGSSFFALEPGENSIKVTSDDTPNVDIIWSDKYL